MRFGIAGVGRIGGNLARLAIEKGHQVVGFDPKGVPGLLEKSGVDKADSLTGLARAIPPPRLVLLYVPHEKVDSVLALLAPRLDAGDVLVDGGNSHWRESIRRARDLEKRGLHFLDCGTSGGVDGARRGSCFMVGGSPEGWEIAGPLLSDLAVPGGAARVGPSGAGHFSKLIHNAIEFGMVQAIAEGVDLLRRSDFPFDLPALFDLWSRGSVIRGWLLELMARGLRDPGLDAIGSGVEDTREVRWAVEYALERQIWAPVLAMAEMSLYRYRDPDSDAGRAVALLRHGFGGHPLPPRPVPRGRRKAEHGRPRPASRRSRPRS